MVSCAAVHVTSVTSTQIRNEKLKETRKKQQLCGFLFLNASGFSVHTVTARDRRWGGGPVLSEDDEGFGGIQTEGGRGN